MDLNPDFRDMLRCLNARGVEHLVVGSFALAFHGRPRTTGSMDLYVRPSPENAARIIDALRDFGFALPEISADDFSRPDRIVQLGHPPVRLDLITSITGVDWEVAWNGRMAGEPAGVPVHFLGLRDCIANKRAVGRAKDLADIDGLE
jgi:hypothetical protein